MRGLMLGLIALAMLCPPGAVAQTRVAADISLDEDGLRGFHLAIGDYYGVPEREVIVVRERGIQDEELPVVFFLAVKSGVTARTIVDMRIGGLSWSAITRCLELSPEIYYIPIGVEVDGPPYGRAYGHFKKRPRTEWTSIQLMDADILNLVNLRLVSEHWAIPPEDVIGMRTHGRPFAAIHDEGRKVNRGRAPSGTATAVTKETGRGGGGKGKR